MKIISASISTTTFTRAYLQRAWESRSTLAEYERNGFSIFFYLTVAGHVEAFMVELMERRLMYSRSVVAKLRDGTFNWETQKDGSGYSTLPIHDTLVGLISQVSGRLEKAALDSLMELFQDVFAIHFSDVLGDLHLDLKALACLRNLCAHGRDFWLRFNQDEDNLLSLDKNPLQLPAQRLLAAKVLPNLKFDAWTHPDFQRALFSDAAMLYFLGRAQEIESKLKGVLAFVPENDVPLMVSLPDLST